MDLTPDTIAFGGMCLALGAGATLLVRLDRRDRKQREIKARRARRVEVAPVAPVTDAKPEPTARQRFEGVGLSPAAGMRGEARILRQETREVRVLSEELLIGAGMREVFAAVYGEEPVRLPLYEEVVSQYEIGQYALVGTQPANPWDKPKPGDPAPKPQVSRLVEHDGQDPKRAAAARVMHLAATRTSPDADQDSMPTPTTPERVAA